MSYRQLDTKNIIIIQLTKTSMKSHKNLIVWQKSMMLVTRIYEMTRTFPHEEIFGITSQMRRAAVSIPSNIAEGYGRVYGKETLKFLSNALGSASELETQLEICFRLGFGSNIDLDELRNLTNEILRMLAALIKTVDPSISLKTDTEKKQ